LNRFEGFRVNGLQNNVLDLLLYADASECGREKRGTVGAMIRVLEKGGLDVKTWREKDENKITACCWLSGVLVQDAIGQV
jgi:hypothetical protein